MRGWVRGESVPLNRQVPYLAGSESPVPMPKARYVWTVQRGANRPTVEVVVSEDRYGNRSTVNLSTLNRGELYGAAGNVRAVDALAQSIDDEKRRDIIADRVWSDGFTSRGYCSRLKKETDGALTYEPAAIAAGESTTSESATSTPPRDWSLTGRIAAAETSETTSTPPATDAADAVAAALRLALATATGAVDADAVRSIIDEALTPIRQRLDDVTRPVEVSVSIAGETVGKVTGRAHEKFPTVLRVLASGDAPFMVGPAGSGKSTIGRMAAEALGVPFYSLACSPQMTQVSLAGYLNPHGAYVDSLFRRSYEHGGVFLLDEIDAGNPGVMVWLNDALANGHAAFPDAMVTRSDRFYFLAGANTFGTGPTATYVGRNALDAATLDRFATVEIGYDEALERDLALAINPDAGPLVDTVQRYRRNVATHGLKVIVSPRTSLKGAAMLAQGFTVAEILAMRVLRGLDATTVAKVVG